jgi:branched-chain amino acid transport system ATP-binding protein
MFEVTGLTGGWGATVVVEAVSLSLPAGGSLAIIGRNGVGKTTLLELLVGRARHRAGTIGLGGRDLTAERVHHRARAGLGYVPQNREVFPSLTVREHLAVAARPGRWTGAAVMELFPSLAARRESLGGSLSGGEQQMLAIGRALVGNPRVVLMDEPSEGLAPIVVERLAEALRAVVAERSLALLLVEQRADIALDLCERCLVMDRGRVVHEGPSDALRDDEARLAGLVGLHA